MPLSHAPRWHPELLLLLLVLVALHASLAGAQHEPEPDQKHEPQSAPEPKAEPGPALSKQQTSRPRVVIRVAPAGAEDLRALIGAELAALAIDVSSDESAAADAVLEIVAKPRSVGVWFAASMRMRTYAPDPRQPPGSDEALARQVAEVLRAELLLAPLEKPAPPPPPPAVVEPPPLPLPQPIAWTVVPVPVPIPAPAAAPAEPEEAFGSLGVAPAFMLSPGPLSMVAQMELAASFRPWRSLQLTFFGDFPITSAAIEDPRGEIVTSATALGASVGYDVLDEAHVRLAPGLGAAWQSFSVNGRANPPFISTRDEASVALLFGGLDLSYEVRSWLALTAGARVGVVVPSLHFSIAGEDLGAFGRPAVQLALGVAVPLRATP